jgi:methionyl-tRNA formyltransferase
VVSMRIIFMGSGALGCQSLRALLASDEDEVVAVVTQPDRPQGRGRKVARSPIGDEVADGPVKVLTPEVVNSSESIEMLRSLRPDIVVIVAYGQLLKKELLSIAPKGCVNLHASLLPKYRGAAPIQWAIVNGETETGLTTMYIDEAMDAGDIIAQKRVDIEDKDTAGSLHDRLAEVGAELLMGTMTGIRSGEATRVAQDGSAVSYAPKLAKSDGRIDWTTSATEISNRVRGFNPWPCCYCEAPAGSGRFLKILATSVEEGAGPTAGAMMDWDGRGPLVQTGEGRVRLIEVHPSGRKPMSGAAFMCGHKRIKEFG